MGALADCAIHRLVADVAVFDRDRVLLVRYHDVRAYDGQRGWFVPDDLLEHTEHPEDAARRIARDHVGLELPDVRLASIESFGNGAWHLVFHYAAELPDGSTVTPGENVAAHAWYALDELPPASETAHEGWTLEIVGSAASGRS